MRAPGERQSSANAMVGIVENDHAQEFSALHARLGHRAPGAMRLIAKDLGIPWRREYDKLVSAGWICESCQMSKMPTPNRLAPRQEPLATRPFQRIYVDIIECVAQETRRKGNHPVLGKYPTRNRDGLQPVHLLVIVDELTRFSWIVPIYAKRSVDVGLAFSEWKNEQLPLSRELRARRTSKFHNEPECNREILRPRCPEIFWFPSSTEQMPVSKQMRLHPLVVLMKPRGQN